MAMRTIIVAAGLALVPAVAQANLNLNIDQPIYSYASFDLAGNPIPNQISYSFPFATPTADNGSTPYWTATTSFPEPAPGEVLELVQLRPDDRTVVMLNGVNVGAYGGLGPGLSTFVFTPGGPEVPQFFQNSSLEGHTFDVIVSGPFVSGVNTLEFIVNNTNHGIFGNITDGGPSRLAFEGFIGAPETTGGGGSGGDGSGGGGSVPEAATWAMMLAGFGVLGALLRLPNIRRLLEQIPHRPEPKLNRSALVRALPNI